MSSIESATNSETKKLHDAVQNGQDVHPAAEKAAGVIAQTEKAAAEVTRDTAHRAADQVRQGFRAMAAAQAPLADISYEGSRRLVEATAGIADVYRGGAERTAEDVQALFGACMNIGRGMQHYQHASLDLINRSMQSMATKRKDLYQAKSPVAFAEIQRDLYLDGMNNMFTASTTLLQLVGQIAQDAVRPLQERAKARS